MFFKGFICGWIGMAAIMLFLIWGMTPRITTIVNGWPESSEPIYNVRDC